MGSAVPDGSAPAGWVPSRRSNSASVMLGRVNPVRLSGPGIPPRRIALLIASIPPQHGEARPQPRHRVNQDALRNAYSPDSSPAISAASTFAASATLPGRPPAR